jgi:hypothetical protein
MSHNTEHVCKATKSSVGKADSAVSMSFSRSNNLITFQKRNKLIGFSRDFRVEACNIVQESGM